MRVRNSVFECDVDNAQFIALKSKLIRKIDSDKDSLRFYNLGDKYLSRIEQYGTKQSYDPEGTLLL